MIYCYRTTLFWVSLSVCLLANFNLSCNFFSILIELSTLRWHLCWLLCECNPVWLCDCQLGLVFSQTYLGFKTGKIFWLQTGSFLNGIYEGRTFLVLEFSVVEVCNIWTLGCTCLVFQHHCSHTFRLLLLW